MHRDADCGGAPAGIGVFASLARRQDVSAWRARVQRVAPYLVGGAMFAVAVWVLRGALRRYGIEDLHAELAALTPHQLLLAITFTALSFMALVGYEWSALGLVGKKMPFGHLCLASFATQSIAHSTGFAFVIGATLRYHFYSDRGLGIADVAKVQMYFTATFTLGVATLAGAVVLIEPGRLAVATGLPPTLWRVAAATALTLVSAYVIWGGFFHRPLRWRGREFILPGAGATLIQIFFGVADLIAVAAALYVLLPDELGLDYLEVLAVFMASIVIGLLSHVPGSLGVFESAVVLLVQPTEEQALPLIGALLAFRAVYYLLPLLCGIVVLAGSELHRWQAGIAQLGDRLRLDFGPATPRLAAVLVGCAGLWLLFAAIPLEVGPAATLVEQMARLVELAGGVGLMLLAVGLWQGLRSAWRWALAVLTVAIAAVAVLTTPKLLAVYAIVLGGLLIASRASFAD
ncbi:MAG: lysylphosphatidylglycerol synthase domain-containing protein [Geminicoccaceae bacterium]